MTRKALDDCFLHDKDRLRHDEALAILQDRVPVVMPAETVPLNDAHGRIAAEDVVATHPVPLHTNAAVDGYAFLHPAPEAPTFISQRIQAGHLSPPLLEKGTAARIFTGAPMPPGADTVAMQEDCDTEGDSVRLPRLKAGANCRKAGEDLANGDTVVTAGTRLKPQHIAALASIGTATLNVRRKLRVALLSNGDELRESGGTSLRPGEVYDANGPMLAALLAVLPVEIIRAPIVADSAYTVREALKIASSADAIITTGGASRGEEDHMLAALGELGTRHLWQLAVKPGRPMMFGQIARSDEAPCFHFGLPGNPVAAMVCFLLYVRPALLALAGATWRDPPRYALPAAFAIDTKKPDRREFARGILRPDGTVGRFPRDGSGLISSLREADGLIEIPEATTRLAKGEPVAFIPFTAFD